jgi:hypothetical protein
MLTLEGCSGRQPEVELRPACILGVPRSGWPALGDVRTPVAGIKTVLSPAQGAENACLQAREGGTRLRDGDGPRPSGKCRLKHPTTPQDIQNPRIVGPTHRAVKWGVVPSSGSSVAAGKGHVGQLGSASTSIRTARWCPMATTHPRLRSPITVHCLSDVASTSTPTADDPTGASEWNLSVAPAARRGVGRCS